MKRIAIITIWIISFLILGSCSSSRQAYTGKDIKISILGGANLGGITENTDMSVVPGVRVPPEATADAFSGATRMGYNIGAHVSKNIRKNAIETGLDYMYNYQTFNYIDAGNFYFGVRDLRVSQLMFPLTYNFNLFRNLAPKADIQLKFGFAGQFNFITTKGTGISLPDYTINTWSKGLTIGLSAYPVQFKNENQLGFYLDAYLGSQIYEDFYNQSSFEMPSSSFIKFGLRYQFNKKN